MENIIIPVIYFLFLAISLLITLISFIIGNGRGLPEKTERIFGPSKCTDWDYDYDIEEWECDKYYTSPAFLGVDEIDLTNQKYIYQTQAFCNCENTSYRSCASEIDKDICNYPCKEKMTKAGCLNISEVKVEFNPWEYNLRQQNISDFTFLIPLLSEGLITEEECPPNTKLCGISNGINYCQKEGEECYFVNEIRITDSNETLTECPVDKVRKLDKLKFGDGSDMYLHQLKECSNGSIFYAIELKQIFNGYASDYKIENIGIKPDLNFQSDEEITIDSMNKDILLHYLKINRTVYPHYPSSSPHKLFSLNLAKDTNVTEIPIFSKDDLKCPEYLEILYLKDTNEYSERAKKFKKSFDQYNKGCSSFIFVFTISFMDIFVYIMICSFTLFYYQDLAEKINKYLRVLIFFGISCLLSASSIFYLFKYKNMIDSKFGKEYSDCLNILIEDGYNYQTYAKEGYSDGFIPFILIIVSLGINIIDFIYITIAHLISNPVNVTYEYLS